MEKFIAIIMSIIMMFTYSFSEPVSELPVFEPTQTSPATTADSTQASEETTATLPEEMTRHTHYYNVSTQEATCIAEGETTYFCECGEQYHEETPALGHIWGNWYTAMEPTYDTPGIETHICARCGASESIPIPQLTKTLSNEDAEAIAQLTLQYINEIRKAEGSGSATDMPGCTEYAKLRSEQMAAKGVADHSYSDSIAAATQLQYGRYIDPSIYGMSGDPYYQVYGGEAVGTGYGSTIEEVAHCLANGVSSSPAHWNYVGKDANVHMSVAVTYNKGCWYCCIITSSVNLDENPLGY